MSLSLIPATASSSLCCPSVSVPASTSFNQVSPGNLPFLSNLKQASSNGLCPISSGNVQHPQKLRLNILGKASEFLGSSLPTGGCGIISRGLVKSLPKCRSQSPEATPQAVSEQAWRKKSPKDTNVLIVGATGYIGKYVAREMLKRGYNVIAVAREKSGIGGKSSVEQTMSEFPGASVLLADVTDINSLTSSLQTRGANIDVVISCLASRNGGKKDSWKIDYQATKNSLDAGVAAGASHFVLLSAICVQKPLLEFQRAKLKFEADLESYGNGLTYSIVRPTAFFKSLGGQVQSVKGGGPYVMFGDGALCACKPISEADLASFIADCLKDEDKIDKILPIGGPGKALTPLEQGQMLFRIVGREPKFIKVPIGIMDFVIGLLDNLTKVFPNLEDAAEFGKIGRYYAAESMLVMNPQTGKYDADGTPSYGTDTLEAFFDRVVQEGMAGQELGDQGVF